MDLIEGGEVCVVKMYNKDGVALFGVYDSEATAKRRIEENKKMGHIREDALIFCEMHTVWTDMNKVAKEKDPKRYEELCDAFHSTDMTREEFETRLGCIARGEV